MNYKPKVFPSAGIVAATLVLVLTSASAALQLDGVRQSIDMGAAWRFYAGEPSGQLFSNTYDDGTWDVVSLPHSMTVYNANLSEFTERGRAMGWYRKRFHLPIDLQSKKVFLEFQGAMQVTTVWVNGNKAGEYGVSG